MEKPDKAPDAPLSSQEVAELMKMGSWRLGRLAIPQIELLVSQVRTEPSRSFRVAIHPGLQISNAPTTRRSNARPSLTIAHYRSLSRTITHHHAPSPIRQIEAAVRDILPDVQPVNLDEASTPFLYMDTMDIRNTHSMAHNLPDPEKSDPAWPRMQIENRVYESFCFRKLHIEVAVQQDGLQVLHCVMYPRNTFDVPILSLDMVAYNGRPTFAIVDPCPVSQDLSLPRVYATSVMSLQQKYGVVTNSDIPEWGRNIFSDFCIQLRPESPEHVGRFLKYALALVHFHLQFARLALPVKSTDDARGPGKEKTREIHESHARFSANQLRNDKTRQILEKRFGADTAREYMERMMFDVEPFPPGRS